jgi:hypothetical protein
MCTSPACTVCLLVYMHLGLRPAAGSCHAVRYLAQWTMHICVWHPSSAACRTHCPVAVAVNTSQVHADVLICPGVCASCRCSSTGEPWACAACGTMQLRVTCVHACPCTTPCMHRYGCTEAPSIYLPCEERTAHAAPGHFPVDSSC